MNSTNLQAGQIVCLEYQHRYLYAEVIQLSALGRRCWVRPLILVVSAIQPGEIGCGDAEANYDLRQGIDLLLPMTLFRVALDTEAFRLLTQLESQDPKREDQIALAHHQLNQLIQQVWQACPSAF